jgi:hypothetical protein
MAGDLQIDEPRAARKTQPLQPGCFMGLADERQFGYLRHPNKSLAFISSVRIMRALPLPSGIEFIVF